MSTETKEYNFGGYKRYRAYLNVSTNGSATSVKINYEARVDMKYGSEYGVGIKLSGSKTGSDTGVLHTSPGDNWTEVAKVKNSFSVSRTKSSQTKTFKATAYGTVVNGYGSAGGSVTTNTITVTINPLASYTVHYELDGGSGSFGDQTKWYGETLPLRTGKPTKTHYTFRGWATSRNGSVKYQPGAKYTSNSAVTLWAVWKKDYEISYNKNGGTGSMDLSYKQYGKNLTLMANRFTRTNYVFAGWSKSQTATTPTWKDKGTYTANADATLFAVWTQNYIPPSLDNFQIYRCDSTGTSKLSGNYYIITFEWNAGIAGNGTVHGSTVTIKEDDTTIETLNYTEKEGTYTSSPINGDGDGKSIIITIQDATDTDESSTIQQEIPSVGYLVDLASNEESITLFGQTQEGQKGLKVQSNAEISGQCHIGERIYVEGHTERIGAVYSKYDTDTAKPSTSTGNNFETHSKIKFDKKLGAGTWVITGTVHFASNSTGSRVIRMRINNTGYESANLRQNAVSGGETRMQATLITSQSNDFNVSIDTYQTSGSNLSIQWYLRAVRIV